MPMGIRISRHLGCDFERDVSLKYVAIIAQQVHPPLPPFLFVAYMNDLQY